jgi:hypothetical protein
VIDPSEKTTQTVLMYGPSYVRMVKRLKDQVCEDPRARNVIITLSFGPILMKTEIGVRRIGSVNFCAGQKKIYEHGIN